MFLSFYILTIHIIFNIVTTLYI
jgi:hypothetical protein